MGTSNKVRLILLVLFVLTMERCPGKCEALRIGKESTGSGGIQIQEQQLSPSSLKKFLEASKDFPRRESEEGSTNGNASPEWETVIDPKLYIITEYDEDTSLPNHITKHNQGNPVSEGEFSESTYSRLRRNSNAGHSLSIVNPLDVLRQRLLLEIARRRNLKQNQHQIIANAELLKNIG